MPIFYKKKKKDDHKPIFQPYKGAKTPKPVQGSEIVKKAKKNLCARVTLARKGMIRKGHPPWTLIIYKKITFLLLFFGDTKRTEKLAKGGEDGGSVFH